MLVFGPFRSVPQDSSFIIFNLSSPTEKIARLPGLFVIPNFQIAQDGDSEKSFDIWYYDYVLNDPIACSSLMAILTELYNGNNVYICIAEYMNDSLISILNESFMKLIQSRYDLKYSIINDISDLDYIQKDGCLFQSVNGIYNFDKDRKRFMQITEEQRLLYGGGSNQ